VAKAARPAVNRRLAAVPTQAANDFGPTPWASKHDRQRADNRDGERRLAPKDGRDDEEEDDKETESKPEEREEAAQPSCHDHEQREGDPQPHHGRSALVVCERVRRNVRLEAWRDIGVEKAELVAHARDVVAGIADPERHLLPLVRAAGQLGDDRSAPIRSGVLAGYAPNGDHFGGLEVGRRPRRSTRFDFPAWPQNGKAHGGTDRY
jgi:hypothetical protein